MEKEALRKVIQNKVEKLKLEKLNPSNFKKELDALMRETFVKECSFWKHESIPDPNWNANWIFLEVLSFKNWQKINVGITFSNSTIHLTIFEGIYMSNFRAKFLEKKMDLIDIWLNHEKFVDFLFYVFSLAIDHANRDRFEDQFSILLSDGDKL